MRRRADRPAAYFVERLFLRGGRPLPIAPQQRRVIDRQIFTPGGPRKRGEPLRKSNARWRAVFNKPRRLSAILRVLCGKIVP
jgi:hypothetical protein